MAPHKKQIVQQMWIKPVQKGVNKNQGETTTKVYTCTGTVKFFSIKPLIINKNAECPRYVGGVQF